MELSVCTIAMRTWPLKQVFELMTQAGCRCADAYPTHISPKMSQEQIDEAMKLAAAYGIRIGSLASGMDISMDDPDPAKRKAGVDEVRRWIDLAVRVGASVIRVTNTGSRTTLDDDYRKYVVPGLIEAATYAEMKKVKLGIENHSGDVVQTIAGSRLLCEAVPSAWFGILYDPGNLLGLDEDYKKGLEVFGRRIVHVHLKDGFPATFNDNYAPRRLSCTMFGKGRLDMPHIFRKLKEIGYKGLVSVEYECWHPEYNLQPVETGLKDCLDYVKALDSEAPHH